MKLPAQLLDRTRRQFLWLTAGGLTSLAALKAAPQDPQPEGPAVTCGIIGTGQRGREILAAFSRMKRARVAACCDVYEPYLRRAAQAAPEARTFTDWRRMLREGEDLQAVVVATPTHLHREMAEACLRAGKHVYCEAPMASTLEDCRAMAGAARQATAVFMVGLQNRANPVHEHAGKFLKARAAGRPLADEGHWFENNSWRRAVGNPAFEEALNWKLAPQVSLGLAGECGVHSFDNTLRYLGRLPEAVTAFGSIMKWNDGRTVPDTVFCVFEFPGGFLSRFEATLGNSFQEKYYLLNGTEGSILMQDTRSWWFKEADAPSLGWEVYASREKIGNEEGIVLLANATKLLEQGKVPGQLAEAGPEIDPLSSALEAFLEAASGGTAPPSGYREGYQSTVMAILAHQALVQRERIRIDRSLFDVE